MGLRCESHPQSVTTTWGGKGTRTPSATKASMRRRRPWTRRGGSGRSLSWRSASRAGLFFGWCLFGEAGLRGAQVLLSVGAGDGAGCQSQYLAVCLAVVGEEGHYPRGGMTGFQVLTGSGGRNSPPFAAGVTTGHA